MKLDKLFILCTNQKKLIKNNIIKSVQIQKMDTIFIITENSKNYKLHYLILKHSDKIDLRRGEKNIALSNLSTYYTWKNIKNHIIIIRLKYLLQNGMTSLNYHMDHA